jgi:hypothetical protein
MTDMRRLINLSEGSLGHNEPPAVTLVKTGRTTLGTRMYDTYNVVQGGKVLGQAYGRYTAPKPGVAGGHTFQMTLKGKDFTGSKARLLAWIEKQTQNDI